MIQKETGICRRLCPCYESNTGSRSSYDFVVATAETYTVREFCEMAFDYYGFELKWEGKDESEIVLIIHLEETY